MRGLDDAKLGPNDPLQPISEPRLPRKRWLFLALVVCVVIVLLVAQGFDSHSPTRRFLALLLDDVRDPRWGALYVLVAYTAGTLLFAPITGMFLATSLALSPLYGFAYCLLGGMWGASLAYLLGRVLGARPLARLRGARLARLQREVKKRPLRSVLIARFLPVGNFTLINLLLGSLHVPFGAFALGCLLGMLPGVLGITLCKGLLERVLNEPTVANVSFALGGLAIVAATFYAVTRAVARNRRDSLAPEASSDAER